RPPFSKGAFAASPLCQRGARGDLSTASDCYYEAIVGFAYGTYPLRPFKEEDMKTYIFHAEIE
ncbi:MAG: hypothetical protein AB1671_21830, partial [Thermodesulfobacteriota bacterium]